MIISIRKLTQRAFSDLSDVKKLSEPVFWAGAGQQRGHVLTSYYMCLSRYSTHPASFYRESLIDFLENFLYSVFYYLTLE